MPIRPEIAALLATPAVAGLAFPPEAVADPDVAADYLARTRRPAPIAATEHVASVYELDAGGSRARCYVPVSEPDGLPVLVYFHGGGWVIGDLDLNDATCRRIANLGEWIVVSVDYRLAPEHRYPAALDDCWRSTVWVHEHAAALGGTPSLVFVGGSSAGGNLAAAVALRARNRGVPSLAAQLLLYPVLDDRMDTPSYEEFATGFLLERHQMAWYWQQYVPDESHRSDPLAVPARE